MLALVIVAATGFSIVIIAITFSMIILYLSGLCCSYFLSPKGDLGFWDLHCAML